jgi:hypothetical protein
LLLLAFAPDEYRLHRIDMLRIFLIVWELGPGIAEALLGILWSKPSTSFLFWGQGGASCDIVTLPARLSAEPGRSTSPYLGSDAGNVSDESKNQSVKGKGRSKYNRKGDIPAAFTSLFFCAVISDLCVFSVFHCVELQMTQSSICIENGYLHSALSTNDLVFLTNLDRQPGSPQISQKKLKKTKASGMLALFV